MPTVIPPQRCTERVRAELNAVFKGVSLALQWCNAPLIIETDCLEIVNILNREEVDRSAYISIIEEIKTLFKVRQTQTCTTHEH